jgi:hypothetical protein
MGWTWLPFRANPAPEPEPEPEPKPKPKPEQGTGGRVLDHDDFWPMCTPPGTPEHREFLRC